MKNAWKTLSDANKQAQGFRRVRAAHRTETAEDYVEMIADLIESAGEARVVDMARRLGVSHATVNKVVMRLKKEGLVNSQPYRALFLTPKGAKMAASCKERHLIIVAFLKSLGISEKTAEMDAEGVEHHVSAETLKAFQKFTRHA